MQNISTLISLPLSYFLWHYTVAWGDLLRLYRNFFWFLFHFFSIAVFFSTLFSPIHRMREQSDQGSAGIIGSFIINTILRCIGFFARLFVILFGLATLFCFSLVSLFLLVLWPFAPLLIILCIATGLIG